MKFRMFEDYHVFDSYTGNDYYYSVFDITPATSNRPHKHEHVEHGLDEYTSNWELLATDTERRRGGDRLWLVNDEHYIHCSRTGMERAGNTLMFSESTPDDLRFTIISNVFEGVSKREFGAIKEEEITDIGNLTVTTPRALIIHKELTKEEQQEYYDDMADLAVTLLTKYYDCQTIDEIKTIVEWYNDERTNVFYEYVPRKPTPLGLLFNSEFELPDEWYRRGDDMNIDARNVLLHHDDYDIETGTGHHIMLSNALNDVSVEYEHNRENRYTARFTHDGTQRGLKNTLEHVMEEFPRT